MAVVFRRSRLGSGGGGHGAQHGYACFRFLGDAFFFFVQIPEGASTWWVKDDIDQRSKYVVGNRV